MSRNINVNPGHYKVAGRERQGEAIHQAEQKQAYTTQQAEFVGDGVPPWEATRHSFVSAQPLEQAPAKKARKPKTKRQAIKAKAKRPIARKTTRKTAASRSGLRERRVKRSTRRR